MPLSFKYRFLYIHVPKCAGTSIGKSLSRLTPLSFYKSGELDRTNPDIWRHATMTGSIHHKEKHLSAYEIKNMIGKEKFDKLFKFAFVRDPSTRIVSFYNFARNHKNPEMKSKHIRIALSSKNVNECISRMALEKDLDLFFNQWRYIYDLEGKSCLVDFVGKTENVNNDFEKICKLSGLTDLFKRKLMKFFFKDPLSIPLLNVSKNKFSEYKEDLTNESKNILRDRCKRDCDLFDYTI